MVILFSLASCNQGLSITTIVEGDNTITKKNYLFQINLIIVIAIIHI